MWRRQHTELWQKKKQGVRKIFLKLCLSERKSATCNNKLCTLWRTKYKSTHRTFFIILLRFTILYHSFFFHLSFCLSALVSDCCAELLLLLLLLPLFVGVEAHCTWPKVDCMTLFLVSYRERERTAPNTSLQPYILTVFTHWFRCSSQLRNSPTQYRKLKKPLKVLF